MFSRDPKEIRLKKVVAIADIKPGDRILDSGSGNPSKLLQYISNFSKYVAIDIDNKPSIPDCHCISHDLKKGVAR